MTFGEHLEELRSRVIRSVVALVLAFIVAMIFQNELFEIVSRPHHKAMEWLREDIEKRNPPEFSAKEFRSPAAVKKLCEAIAPLNGGVPPASIERLNELLQTPNLYEKLLKNRPELQFSEAVDGMIKETSSLREGKSYAELGEEEKDGLTRLNRRLMEEAYPQETPIRPTPRDIPLVGLTYPATFFAFMKLAIIAALFAASPFVAYQLWGFVAAGLFPKEKKYVYVIGPFSFILFIAGCLFGYFAMIPVGLYYLAGYADPNEVTPMISISEYLDLVLVLTIVMGIVFELPLLMVFCSKIGLIRPSTFSKWRRFAIVANFIFAAVITPTGDPVNLCIVAFPMIILYEFGILLSKLFTREKPAPAAV